MWDFRLVRPDECTVNARRVSTVGAGVDVWTGDAVRRGHAVACDVARAHRARGLTLEGQADRVTGNDGATDCTMQRVHITRAGNCFFRGEGNNDTTAG